MWPDSDGDAARNALDNALHRLRRLLGGDDRVVLRHGSLLLNPQRCWTDVGALEALLARLPACPLARLPDCPLNELPALGASIRHIYVGPLLADDPQPIVAERRAALHRRVRRGLEAASARLASAGLNEAAVILRQSLPDP